MTRIILLTTGGTISTTVGLDGRSAPTLDADRLASIPSVGAGLTVESRELTREPSWRLTPADMARIAVAARDAARSLSAEGGVVVTHGTTTLEYTAFLTELVLDAEAPVVFTGAMRRADDRAPDGPRNLADAVAVAASPAARRLGALVVFAGRIIPASRAWKARRVDEVAFVDLGGELGSVARDRVAIRGRVSRAAPFSGRLDEEVALVKAVPGTDGRLVDAAVEAAHGLVVEALPGVGGIPPAMVDAVARAAARMPVVVAPRAPFGRAPEVATGGTGEPLRALDLISAGSLSAEQSWVLLMTALGDSGGADEARRRFRSTVAAFDGHGAGSGEGGDT